MVVSTETGEVLGETRVRIEAGGRSWEGSAEQLEMAAEGMSGREGLRWEVVLVESQRRGSLQTTVELAVVAGELTFGIVVRAPERMTPEEAKVLHGMLGRALHAARAGAT